MLSLFPGNRSNRIDEQPPTPHYLSDLKRVPGPKSLPGMTANMNRQREWIEQTMGWVTPSVTWQGSCCVILLEKGMRCCSALRGRKSPNSSERHGISIYACSYCGESKPP